jgi:hypothetical protein
MCLFLDLYFIFLTITQVHYNKEKLQLLYLVSLYGSAAHHMSDQESWIREASLMVLCFELIVGGVMDLDYSPVKSSDRIIWYHNHNQ